MRSTNLLRQRFRQFSVEEFFRLNELACEYSIGFDVRRRPVFPQLVKKRIIQNEVQVVIPLERTLVLIVIRSYHLLKILFEIERGLLKRLPEVKEKDPDRETIILPLSAKYVSSDSFQIAKPTLN